MQLTYRLEVPNRADYPRDEIIVGLRACGYTQQNAGYNGASQVLVTWSPWVGSSRYLAVREHAACNAGPIIVVENGWLQPICGVPYWSVCLWGWNGTGVWKKPVEFWWNERLSRMLGPGHLPEPAYDPDGPVVVVEQRGHPSDPRTMPPDWHKVAARAVNRNEDATINAVIRHKDDPEPIAEYLIRVRPRGVVTWSSAVASWALLYGIPVAHAGPSIWCWELATRWTTWQSAEYTPAPPTFRLPSHAVRLDVFGRLAWSQWTREELVSGEPFRRLLEPVE